MYHLKTTINEPTRITKKSGTCLDQIITNIDNVSAKVHDLGLSDHTAQTCVINLSKPRETPLKYWYDFCRDYNPENKCKFMEY